MSEYNPDVWVIVEFSGKKVEAANNGGRYHRVLAGWYGGYTGSDSWQMNSGITQIIDKGDYYEIHGDSGSVYNCGKVVERFSGYTQSVYAGFVEQNSEAIAMKQIDIADILERYTNANIE